MPGRITDAPGTPRHLAAFAFRCQEGTVLPRYDYRCTACANEFELMQKFSEAGAGECPLCGAAGQRVFHAVPVIYKGSGFYTTDYGRPKRPPENAESQENAPAPASANGSTESTPDRSGASESGGSSESAAPAAAAANSD